MISENFVGPLFNRVSLFDKKPKLIVFHRSGYTAHFSSGHHQTGYDTPESFFLPSKWWAHDWTTTRDAAQCEGVPWVDLRKAVESESGRKWVYVGPLVNVDLPIGEVDRLTGPDALMAVAFSQSSGEFATLLALHAVSRNKGEVAGPLDGVSILEYCDGWKNHGADIGFVNGGEFVKIS